jgi:hypothetical protein
MYTDFEPPGFETNDMGRLNFADGIRFDTTLRYRETTPGKLFRSYIIGASQNNEGATTVSARAGLRGRMRR